MTMTNKQKILEVLRERLKAHLLSKPNKSLHVSRWITPTAIGMACGKSYGQASSWACQHLKRLRDRKLVQWKAPGLYAIAEAGVAELAPTDQQTPQCGRCRNCGTRLELHQTQHGSHILMGENGDARECGPIDWEPCEKPEGVPP